MGWYGSWFIEYKGKNKDKFVKLAKLIIPNYKERFEEDGNKLECTRSLSWYSADSDLTSILEYLDNGDELHVSIDGESHPIVKLSEAIEAGIGYEFLEDEYDEYDEYDEDIDDEGEDEDDPDVELIEEKQIFSKKNGKVEIENIYPDNDRWGGHLSGNSDDFSWCIQYNETKDLKESLEFWANNFVDDKEMLDISCKYFNDLMKGFDLSRDNDACKLLQKLKDASVSSEKMMEFFKDYVSKASSEKNSPSSPYEKVISSALKKRDILKLGGMDILVKACEKRGVQDLFSTLKMFGYEINDVDELDF